MRFLANRLLIVSAVVIVGCAKPGPNLQIQASRQPHPWTHLNFYNDPDNFQFAIVADRTGRHRAGIFAEAVKKLNLLKPEFVLCVGDLIEGCEEDDTELDNQWDEFDSLVNRLQMPFFYLAGNHDINNEVTEKKWQQRFGRSYYHFTYRNVLFLCLNTEDHDKTWVSDQQVEYFEKVLKANRNVRWTLVFMHEPLWRPDKITDNWAKLESLLANRAYTVFAGHRHTYTKSVRNSRTYYLLATTGASGDGEDGKPAGVADCQFDHIVWVTMTDDGPVMANLLLEGILDDEPCPQ